MTYSPRGNSDIEQNSRTWMHYLKEDLRLPPPNPPILMSESISKEVKERITTLPFAHFFRGNPILVPIPKSSLMKPGTLWVPQRLANALVRNELGIAVEESLIRVVPLPKAATSSIRPTVAEHYSSLTIQVQKKLSEPKEILLVDDVITRGDAMLGAAHRLRDAFPEVHIRAFAAMRTMNPLHSTFKAINDPCKGEITFDGQKTLRRP
jgi:hypothetical protein